MNVDKFPVDAAISWSSAVICVNVVDIRETEYTSF